MRNGGYWPAELLSISRILRRAPARYSRAYVLTETDEGDATYFLIHQLEVIRRAVEDLHAYLRREAREIRELERQIHLTGLEPMGLLIRAGGGRRHVYVGMDDLAQRVGGRASARRAGKP